MAHDSAPLAAAIPLILLALTSGGYALRDILRHRKE